MKLVAGVCCTFNLTPDFIESNMTFEELCAYAIAARNYHSFYLREQAVAIVNTISESINPSATIAEEARSYDDFLQAMGGV